MVNMVKVQKGNVVKTIPFEYKKDYINAGWDEVKTTNVGVSSSTKYDNKH